MRLPPIPTGSTRHVAVYEGIEPSPLTWQASTATITQIDQNTCLFQVVKSVKSIKLFTCRACGAMENRTPIYDLQNHCNSRYTIAPVTCLFQVVKVLLLRVYLNLVFTFFAPEVVNNGLSGFVLRTGFEPVPYHRKWYVLTPSLTQQIVGICSSHILGFPHTLERLERIELSSFDWKSKVITIIR